MSVSVENYLKALFILDRRGSGVIKNADLAHFLKVRSSSVSEMIKRLEKKQYLFMCVKRGIRLTKEGRQLGQTMLRRHRILELFLNQVLKMPWGDVHQEAEILEHAASDKVVNGMDRFLGFPEYDPHGDPIPRIDGSIPETKQSTLLAEAPHQTCLKVVRVNDESDSFLSYIQDLGLTLFSNLEIVKIHDFDQSMIVKINKKEHTLSKFTSQQIWVTIHNES